MHHLGTRAGASLLAAGVALALTAVVAPAASARIIGRGSDVSSDTYTFTACGGIALRVQVDATDAWVDKLRGGDLASFAYLTPWFTHATGSVHQTITNLDTGRAYTAVNHTSDWDQKALAQVGTVGTYQRRGTNHFTVVRADGSTFRRENGAFSFQYRYDTKGTPDPADDTDEFIDGSWRQTGTLGTGDFCTDVLALTS